MKNHIHIIPTLDELISSPEKVQSLSSQEAMAMAIKIATIQPLLIAMVSQMETSQKKNPDSDKLLTAKEAANKLGCSKHWLYQNASKLPFTRRLSSKLLRFSQAGIDKHIRTLASH